MYLPITKNTGNRRLIPHLSSPENLRPIHQETKKLGRITFWGELRSPLPIPAGLRPSTLSEEKMLKHLKVHLISLSSGPPPSSGFTHLSNFSTFFTHLSKNLT